VLKIYAGSDAAAGSSTTINVINNVNTMVNGIILGGLIRIAGLAIISDHIPYTKDIVRAIPFANDALDSIYNFFTFYISMVLLLNT
jgi:hypothetical protein